MTLDQARPVTSEMGYVYYYEVPAQVQITVTLNENRDEEYQFAVRWFDADLQLDGYSNTADVAYALATPSGGLTEYPAAPRLHGLLGQPADPRPELHLYHPVRPL